MRGVTRAKRIIRNTRRLVEPVAAILIYHRVIELSSDLHNLAITPQNFARHLEYIHDKYTPIRLTDLADGMKDKTSLPYRSVVVTFDDGYEDNYSQARPLLEQYEVPGTIFVVSQMVNSAREFWWDELERLFLHTEDLPESLTLRILGQETVWPLASLEQRQVAMKTIHQQMRRLPAFEREQVLAELSNWARFSRIGRSGFLPMKSEQVRQIAQSPYIEIGAHTQTHPVLSSQDTGQQYNEIVESRTQLEALLGKPVRTFSYPYGNPEDFDRHSVEIVRSAGFAAAVTTIQGAVDIDDDRHQLKRCEVNNWDIDVFRKKLNSFFYQ